MELVITAPAKINLALRITGKRADGYHDLCALNVFADWGDYLSITPATADSLTIVGPMAEALANLPVVANSVWRILQAYRAAGGQTPGLRITLYKNIPPQTGLGGGSADAAALLRYLKIYGQHNADLSFAALAQKIGADGPMCYFSAPCITQGIGDRITPVMAFPSLCGWLLLPPSRSATPDAFARVRHFSQPPDWAARQHWTYDELRQLSQPANDFYPVLQPHFPDWPDLTTALIGTGGDVLLHGLSGSGSAHFILCPDRRAQQRVLPLLRDLGGTLQAVRIAAAPIN